MVLGPSRLKFANPSFQLPDTARADDIFVSLDCLQAALQRQLNSKLGSTPARRAT